MKARLLLTASALLAAPLVSACDIARPARAQSATASAPAALGVAGDCPTGAGPMRPAGAVGAGEDHNRDGYVCAKRGLSITGDSLHFFVDNDAAADAGQRAAVWDLAYGGM